MSGQARCEHTNLGLPGLASRLTTAIRRALPFGGLPTASRSTLARMWELDGTKGDELRRRMSIAEKDGS
jgi:hypothetical protein